VGGEMGRRRREQVWGFGRCLRVGAAIARVTLVGAPAVPFLGGCAAGASSVSVGAASLHAGVTRNYANDDYCQRSLGNAPVTWLGLGSGTAAFEGAMKFFGVAGL
jgi:hypothetical protein